MNIDLGFADTNQLTSEVTMDEAQVFLLGPNGLAKSQGMSDPLIGKMIYFHNSFHEEAHCQSTEKNCNSITGTTTSSTSCTSFFLLRNNSNTPNKKKTPSSGTDVPISLSTSARTVMERRRQTWLGDKQATIDRGDKPQQQPRPLSFPELPASSPSQGIYIDGRCLRDRFAASTTCSHEIPKPQRKALDTPLRPLVRSTSRARNPTGIEGKAEAD